MNGRWNSWWHNIYCIIWKIFNGKPINIFTTEREVAGKWRCCRIHWHWCRLEKSLIWTNTERNRIKWRKKWKKSRKKSKERKRKKRRFARKTLNRLQNSSIGTLRNHNITLELFNIHELQREPEVCVFARKTSNRFYHTYTPSSWSSSPPEPSNTNNANIDDRQR